MIISAVIPVREGSRRVKEKNIRPFAGTTLLENKLSQLKRVSLIDNIIISSDSEKMLEIGLNNNVIARKRPREFCDEQSKTFNQVVEYIASQELEADILVWVPCVCPLIDETYIEMAIEEFIGCRQDGFDSVVSSTLIKEYLFNEQNEPINFSIEHHVPSQLLPAWHIIINGFFIAKPSDMVRWKFVYGKKPKLIEVEPSKSIDIDDETDFFVAEQLMKMHICH